MADYPPYVNAYNSISKLFSGIKSAAVPPKVSQNFLESVLDLKSSSHRALLPLLKKLGFIDSSNVPTQAYKPLFNANEYAQKLSKTDLQAKFRNLSGAAENDAIIPTVTSTFLELSK